MSEQNQFYLAVLLLFYTLIVDAAFELNFQQHSAGTPAVNGVWTDSVCNSGSYGPCGSFSQGPNEPTRFIYEYVNIDGIDYVHLVVGDPANYFAQEIYIEGTQSSLGGSGAAHGASDLNAPTNGPAQASGNPNKVVMRQVLSDNVVTTEFLKDSLLNKALITQSLTTADITSSFSIDMRSILYTDMLSTAPITNTQMLVVPSLGTVDFDMSTDSDNSVYTGGSYIYTEGSGLFGSEGSYSYTGGTGYDVTAVDWCVNWDNAQNSFTTTCQ